MNSVETWWAKIYIAGPMDVIEHECRKFCVSGLCVTVEPMKFIYTGGEETGAVIGFVNYPRFPSEPQEITQRAIELAEKMVAATYQRTALVVTPLDTFWIKGALSG